MATFELKKGKKEQTQKSKEKEIQSIKGQNENFVGHFGGALLLVFKVLVRQEALITHKLGGWGKVWVHKRLNIVRECLAGGYKIIIIM